MMDETFMENNKDLYPLGQKTNMINHIEQHPLQNDTKEESPHYEIV